MKLTKQAISKINNPVTIAELMKGLGFSELWIKRLIAQNRVNGPLTTFSALRVIREHTGMEDSQILESPKAKKGASIAQKVTI